MLLPSLVLLSLGVMLMVSCQTSPVGLVEGRLRPCPKSPNCVCSQDPSEDRRIDPLPFTGPAAEARQRLLDVLADLPRTRVITADDDYLHVEFRSALFRFVDDVEFLIDAEAGLIHVRSASRVGYSDLGANRRRVERIRVMFTDLPGLRVE